MPRHDELRALARSFGVSKVKVPRIAGKDWTTRIPKRYFWTDPGR
jgi:hypothetical protein